MQLILKQFEIYIWQSFDLDINYVALYCIVMYLSWQFEFFYSTDLFWYRPVVGLLLVFLLFSSFVGSFQNSNRNFSALFESERGKWIQKLLVKALTRVSHRVSDHLQSSEDSLRWEGEQPKKNVRGSFQCKGKWSRED